MTVSNVRKLVAKARDAAGLPFPVHPHMFRHACGYKPANDGRETRVVKHHFGHKNISHTVRYENVAPDRFKGFWQDQSRRLGYKPSRRLNHMSIAN